MFYVNRRSVFTAVATVVAAGCGNAGRLTSGLGGDHVAYSLWNATEEDLQMTELRSIDGQYLTTGRIEPKLNHSRGWKGGGSVKLPDAGHSVPEKVKLSWRLPPKPGQKTYEGDLVGPFELPLRSRVPADVVAKVHGSTRYRLEMAFSVGVEPIQFRWRLIEANLDSSTAPRTELQRGGDWR